MGFGGRLIADGQWILLRRQRRYQPQRRLRDFSHNVRLGDWSCESSRLQPEIPGCQQAATGSRSSESKPEPIRRRGLPKR